MQCIKCKSTDRLDRVVRDIPTDTEVGGLCESCLDTRFDPVFRDDIWQADSGCAVCANDPHYQLPLIDCIIEFSDGREDIIEYGVRETTVRLCTEHFKEVLTETPEEIQVAEELTTQP